MEQRSDQRTEAGDDQAAAFFTTSAGIHFGRAESRDEAVAADTRSTAASSNDDAA